MEVLDYQWDVAARYWSEIDALARASDVRVAIEMHPHNLAFSPHRPPLCMLRHRGGPAVAGQQWRPHR